LQALGYVAGAANAQNADLAGADPKEHLAVLQAFVRADTLTAARRWAEGYTLLAPFEESGALFRSTRASFAVNAGPFDLGEPDIRTALEEEPDRPDYLKTLALAPRRPGDLRRCGRSRAIRRSATRCWPRRPIRRTRFQRCALRRSS
jgi:hypothetical protein